VAAMDRFNPDTWKQQWEAFMSAPYIMFPLIAIAGFLGWWLRGVMYEGKVAGLTGRIIVFEDRLRLAAEKAESADVAKSEVERQFQAYKAEVGDGALAAAAAKVEAAIDELDTANNAVSDALAAADAPRYMTAYEVIHYLADDTEWGTQARQYLNADGMRKNVLFEAQAEFKRIAEQGNIHPVGRLNGGGQHVQIPDTYWMAATINPFSLGSPDISQTMAAVPNPDGIPVYKNVRILRADVERAWPASK
jgi:hypothetical protein